MHGTGHVETILFCEQGEGKEEKGWVGGVGKVKSWRMPLMDAQMEVVPILDHERSMTALLRASREATSPKAVFI